MSDGANALKTRIRAAGEAVLKFDLCQMAAHSPSQPPGAAKTSKLGARAAAKAKTAPCWTIWPSACTQLLHEQGVAAGVDVWEDNGNLGFSIYGGDGVRASSLSIGGKFTTLETVETPGMVGGLRDGVFARRFEVGGIMPEDGLFKQRKRSRSPPARPRNRSRSMAATTASPRPSWQTQLNAKLRQKGIAAAAYLVDTGGGAYTLRIDALHDMVDVSAVAERGRAYDADIVAPGAWASGGLPVATSGQPFGDSVRSYSASGSPLSDDTGALDIQVVVATANGNKTISLAITAQERLDNPDLAPGQWSDALQARLDCRAERCRRLCQRARRRSHAMECCRRRGTASGFGHRQWRCARVAG